MNALKITLSCLFMSFFSGFEGVKADDCDFSNNKLKNGSFEETNRNGVVTNWTTAGGVSLSRASGYQVCGQRYGLMTYDGNYNNYVRIYQDVVLDNGINSVSLVIWGGIHDRCNAELKLIFLNASGKEISGETQIQSVTKDVSDRPSGLRKYTFRKEVPAGAKWVRVEAGMKRTTSQRGVYFKVEAAILTFESTSLPVTLSKFSGKSSETGVALNWETTGEADSETFEVQHSLDGASWNAVGQVAAKGNYDGLSTYNLHHESASAGHNYYRLKMTDRDGSFEMSRIIAVEHSFRYTGKAETYFYPNPSTGKVRLQVPDDVRDIAVFDMTGRAISRAAQMKSSEEMDLSRLANGAYLVSWSDRNGRKFSQRLIISR